MDVTVFNDVFGIVDAEKILAFRSEIVERYGVKCHFSFDRKWSSYNSVVEHFIDDFLTKLGDDSRYIEYWIRTEWLNMECHQDVEENLFKTESEIITPINGHVVYLDEVSKEASTLVFDQNFEKMYSVTPRIGRVTRFDGPLFHYVPCPFTYIMGDNKCDKIKRTRSVLLFNTWDERCPVFPIKQSNFNEIPRCNPRDEWFVSHIPFFPLIEPINVRFCYMGNEIRRLGKDKIEEFLCDRFLRNYTQFRFSCGTECPCFEIRRNEKIK